MKSLPPPVSVYSAYLVRSQPESSLFLSSTLYAALELLQSTTSSSGSVALSGLPMLMQSPTLAAWASSRLAR